MANTPSSEIDDLIARLTEDPARTAILTDVDGTLAPISERPEGATVPQRARQALDAIRERFAVVGCISGRRATEARRLVGVEGITYSGNHGIELLEPGSQELRFDLALRGHVDAAASFSDGLDPGKLEQVGLRREDKGPIQAFHWRGAEAEQEAEGVAREIAEQAGECGLEPHWGRKVLELRPHGGGGKGAAVQAVLAGSEVELAVYAGDDRTDLDAFRCLRELVTDPGPLRGAICVGIDSPEGPSELPTDSDLLLTGPEHWIEVLDRLGR